MEELAEYSDPNIVRVNKSTPKEAISIISKEYYLSRDVQPFEKGMTGIYVISGKEDYYPPSNQMLKFKTIKNIQVFLETECFIDSLHHQNTLRYLMRDNFKILM